MPLKPPLSIFRRFFLCILLLSICFMTAGASASEPLVIDADQQFDFAGHLFKAEKYETAAAEYDRFVYFFPDDHRVDKAKYMAAVCYFKAGQWEKAKTGFNALTFPFKDTVISANAYFMLSKCHLRMGQTHQATADLRNLATLTRVKKVKDAACYELAWISINSGVFDNTPDCFESMGIEQRRAYGIDPLKSALLNSDALPYKNPKLAGFMSGIIPGAGQLYIERPKDAFTALLINAGLILAAYTAFDDDNTALGAVISFVEFGFYAGNIYGATTGAHKFNKNLKNRYIQHLNQEFRVGIALSGDTNGPAVLFRFDF